MIASNRRVKQTGWISDVCVSEIISSSLYLYSEATYNREKSVFLKKNIPSPFLPSFYDANMYQDVNKGLVFRKVVTVSMKYVEVIHLNCSNIVVGRGVV